MGRSLPAGRSGVAAPSGPWRQRPRLAVTRPAPGRHRRPDQSAMPPLRRRRPSSTPCSSRC
eukprot:3632833-Heterocapsa_arctica.AAC.1